MGLDNPLHIAFLLVILLLVFGARRLPEIGRSLGEGMRGFKDSLTGQSQQPEKLNAAEQAPAPPAQQAAAPVAAPAPTPAQQAPAPQGPPTAEPPAAAS
jgi:sec-independent protein translocase protein TatA